MKSCINLSVLFALFFLSACAEPVNMPDVSVMETLLAENPDSLAYILEEKVNPDLLSHDESMDYIWWLANTRSRQHRSLINDSLIHDVLDEHKKKDSPLLLTTYRLAAQQAESAGDKTKAEALLYSALALAEEKKDTTMVFNLIDRLVYSYEAAQDREKANDFIRLLTGYRNEGSETSAYLNLVRLYSRINEADSVFKYAPAGIAAAIRENRPMEEYQITRMHVESLNGSGKAEQSLVLLRGIENKMPVGSEIVGTEIKLNYISTWIALGRYDSAQVCIDYFDRLFEQFSPNRPAEVNIIKVILDIFQTVIDTKKGNSFNTNSLATVNQLFDDNRLAMRAEKERLFVQNKLQRDKLNLEIEKAKLKQRMLSGVLGLLLVIAVIVFIYQRKLLKKERNIQSIKEQLHLKSRQIAENEAVINQNEHLISELNSQADETGEIRNELEELSAENKKMEEKNRQLQNEIQTFSKEISAKAGESGFYERLSFQNARLLEREQFLASQLIQKTPVLNDLSKNPRYIEASQWSAIIHAVNQLFDDFSVRLHIDYPSLTEEDICYCCLLKLRLSNGTISSLMGISPSSVTKRKQRIKEKLNQHLSDKLEAENLLEVYLWKYN